MAYKLYMAGTLMPITPSKVTVKINNQNKTMTLINGEEINILKAAGLSDVSFELVLPQVSYPFSNGGAQSAAYYLSLFERLKVSKTPFQFILNRQKPGGGMFHYTNLTVGLETYEITDDAGEGFDVKVKINLKQYRAYILCPEHDASGIVFEGVAYHLLGRAAMDELETVSLEETDAGTEITKATEAGGIVFVTLAEAGSIDAETAAEHADLFAEWAFPVGYTVGQIRRYNGTLYKCVQAHTSQADWTPDTASSLWSKTSDPAEEWPEWSQPVGAHDAYSKGAKVSHKEKHWISTVDSNVWEPGVYGWEESTNGV